MSPFEVEVRKEAHVTFVYLKGILDISSAHRLARELACVEKQEPEVLCFDLRGLEFIDSSGLRVIVAADIGARRNGRRVEIIRGPERVHRVFQVTQLEERLNFVESSLEM